MSVRNILDASGKIAPQFLPPSAVPFDVVRNPLTADLLCDNFALTSAGTVNTTRLETDSIAVGAGSLQTAVAVLSNLEVDTGKTIEYLSDIKLKGGVANEVIIDSIPQALSSIPSVVSYDTVTHKLYYQTISSSGVSSVSGTAPIAVDNTTPSLPVVSLDDSAVTAGVYTYPSSITVDAKGLVQDIQGGSAPSGGGGYIIDSTIYYLNNPFISFAISPMVNLTIYKVYPSQSISNPLRLTELIPPNQQYIIKNVAAVGSGLTLRIVSAQSTFIIDLVPQDKILLINNGNVASSLNGWSAI